MYCLVLYIDFLFLVRFGGDLLSHVLRRSTIGVTALNGRVRDGIGCLVVAMTTKPKQKQLAAILLLQNWRPVGAIAPTRLQFWNKIGSLLQIA